MVGTVRIAIRFGGIIRCDATGCTCEFPSYSVLSIIREQAQLQGWARVKAWQITDNDSPRRKLDVCPEHARVAEDTKQRRLAEIAAKRAAAREALKRWRDSEQAEKRAARLADRLAKREAKDAAKHARAEARRIKREQLIEALQELSEERETAP